MNSAFDELVNLFKQKETFEIEKNWKNFPLNDLVKHKDSIKKISGVYCIMDSNNRILYIGKAKSIYSRLKSHHKATKGEEKAEAWKQFFEHFNAGLTSYYYQLDFHPEDKAENIRQIMERTLQLKYDPLFDKIYNKGHKRVSNFKELIKAYY